MRAFDWITALALVVGLPAVATAQMIARAWVVASGATDASGTGTRLFGTVGQPVTGASAAGASALLHGFWGVGRTSYVVGVEDGPPPAPTRFAFEAGHPTPFRDRTFMTFALPQPEHVLLRLFDVRGRLIRTLVDGMRGPGFHRIPLSGDGLGSGVYFARFEAGSYRSSRKLVHLR